MKPATFVGAYHICPKSDGNKPHVGGKCIEGATSVFIEKKPACRQGDKLLCNSPNQDVIQAGSSKLFIEKKPAAQLGSPTAHGGRIIEGARKVFFGG